MRIDKSVGSSNCLLMLLAVLESCACKRRWTYEFINAEAYSENELKLKPEVRIERVGRHRIGISGSLDVHYDIDNTTMIEMIFFQSPTGNLGDLRPMPFAIPKQVFINMKKTYDEVVVPNFRNCTNLPVFEGDLLLPFPRNFYTFNMCTADNGQVPEIVAEGLYKNIVAFSGEVKWNVTFYVNIKTKLI